MRQLKLNKGENKMTKRHIVHGEANLFEVDSIPDGAKKLIPSSAMIAGNGLIIAESETSGNHHVIEMKAGVEFFEKDGTLYMRNTQPTTVNCVHAGRHDTVDIPPSIWKRKIAKEFDYLTMEKRNVAD